MSNFLFSDKKIAFVGIIRHINEYIFGGGAYLIIPRKTIFLWLKYCPCSDIFVLSLKL